jgi:hypothetical protein
MGIATILSGNSEVSRRLSRMGQQRTQHLRQSNVFGNQDVVSELATLCEECRMDNWDGSGARAIATETSNHALRFLAALPLRLEKPSLGVEPDGHITLEWYRNPRWIVSISVGPGDMFYYAGLFESRKVNGSEPFFPEIGIPTDVLKLIQRTIKKPRNVQS